jgi:flagellar biosynthetic protein FliP
MRAIVPAPRTIGGRAAVFIGLLAFFVLFAFPAFAQAAATAVPTPVATPGVGEAVDRALGDLGGGNAPLSLSLQVLIIMGLLRFCRASC